MSQEDRVFPGNDTVQIGL